MTLPERRRSNRWTPAGRALAVGLAYAVLSLAWIFASDLMASALATSRAAFVTISTWKGSIFVSLMACGLGALYYRIARRTSDLESALQRLRIDEITAIPNRQTIEELLHHRCRQAGAERGGFGVILVKLIDLERVNASLGRSAGDRILVTAARRLDRVLRPEDLVGRMEGNTFALVLRLPTDEDTARAVGERAVAAFDMPIRVEGVDIKIDLRLGVGMSPIDGQTPQQLLDAAGRALRMGKLGGRNNVITFASHDLDALTSLEVEGALRHALRRRDLVAYYQPQVCSSTGEVVGAEALARWPSTEGRWVPPSEFIPVAETSGMIEQLTALMLETTIAQVAEWDAAGYRAITLGVNLSGADLQGTRLIDTLDRLLSGYGVSGERLMLEITESRFLEDPEQAIRVLRRLRERGVRIAVDDFGTGYSSLGYLTRLPVDSLKIDRTFVTAARGASEQRAVLDAICRMAGAMRLETVAEGVETASEAALARELGCHCLQGYLVSPPLPAEDFAARFLGRDEAVSVPLTQGHHGSRVARPRG